MTQYEIDGIGPNVHEEAFVHPDATVIGDVTIGSNSSIWPSASVRGDSDSIEIGERTSIQDGVVIHTEHARGTRIGDGVTVGHNAIVHACEVEDDCLIGMGATVLSGATIGTGSIIAAGALVPEETEVPPGSVVMGVPGKVVRETTEDDIEHIRNNAQEYVDKVDRFRPMRRLDEGE